MYLNKRWSLNIHIPFLSKTLMVTLCALAVFQKFSSSVYCVLKVLLRAQGRVFSIRCCTKQLDFYVN